MKKIFITLGAILVFGIASAQTDTGVTKATAPKTKTLTKPAKSADTRSTAQQKKDAERNINSMQLNSVPIPPASAPGNVNTNSSAMPQVTPSITAPPPGAPITPQPVGSAIPKPAKP